MISEKHPEGQLRMIPPLRIGMTSIFEVTGGSRPNRKLHPSGAKAHKIQAGAIFGPTKVVPLLQNR